MFSKLATLYKSLIIQLCFFLAANNIMAKPFIIFHFEGNVADTIMFEGKTILNYLNELAYKKSNGTAFDTENDIEIFRNKSSSEVISDLNIQPYHMIECFRNVLIEMSLNIDTIQPITGMRKALEELKDAGFELGIVTNNLEKSVVRFLEKNNLYQFFEGKIIVGDESTMFKMHDLLDLFVTKFNLNSNEVFFVGNRVSHAETVINCKHVNNCIIVLAKESYSSPSCYDNWVVNTTIPTDKSIISYSGNRIYENLAQAIKNYIG